MSCLSMYISNEYVIELGVVIMHGLLSLSHNTLQLFTEYGKLAMNQDDNIKAFQVLFVFIV